MTAFACMKHGFSLANICAASQTRTNIEPTIRTRTFTWIVVAKGRCYKSYWQKKEGAANGKDNADGGIDAGIRDILTGFLRFNPVRSSALGSLIDGF
jgi:hypothetical protein